MVAEIAPLVLYLRHVLGPGDLLAIEEPEAHLHPKSQTILAKILVRTVNLGLSILLTTHSEFFLQQISNSIIAAKADPSAREEAGLSEDDAIDSDKVGVYTFDPTSDGTVVKPLPVTRHGIEETTFSDVAGELYDAMVALDPVSLRPSA